MSVVKKKTEKLPFILSMKAIPHFVSVSLLLLKLSLQSQAFQVRLSKPSIRHHNTRGILSDFQLHATLTADETKLSSKQAFLQSLDEAYRLNSGTEERTALLNRMISEKVELDVDEFNRRANILSSDRHETLSIKHPGKLESIESVGAGTWQVIYAPHMTTMAKLGGGEFQVQYILNKDGTMESHARCDFPLFNILGYLSVSGTYGSVSDTVCRVDFDEAWVKEVPRKADGTTVDDIPYESISSVPDSTFKSLITSVGRALFIKEFSVFPVSYLDEDLVVFDFELLRTRICARKVPQN